MNPLRQLQDWYHSQCNGDWEHSNGIKIDTLDNPGWSLKIDLEDTALQEKPFTEFTYGTGTQGETSGDEWVICKLEGSKFVAYGGPHKLDEMITIFLEWAADNQV